MWWRGRSDHLSWLKKPPSCTAFSSPPPPILELLHCVFPTARDTAIVTSGGYSCESCNTLATGLFGGEVCRLSLQRTSYGYGYGSFWSLARLLHAPGKGNPFYCLIFGGGICRVTAYWMSSSSTASGVGSSLPSNTRNYCDWVRGKTQVATTVAQGTHGIEDPRRWPMAMPQS
jgi:hypothetical protein